MKPNLIIPDFPHNIRIRLARLKFLFAKSLPSWLSQFRKAKLRQLTGQTLSNVRKKYKKKINRANLVSSNLNSKQLRFYGAHPILHT